jgi:hypothetical protein
MTYGHWGWPQIVVAVLWGIGLIMHAALHGQDMKAKWNFHFRLCSTAFAIWLLWMGGWWE